ncbi:MAG TPA: polysaccharide deacetylase family protein [Magnetospirillum sp.]|jgi:peptidoglycan/xylan/chitin deacetylase (PgdA/CDA1 family)|nr:polysaccharide deacetylase family protein [Magnetospirillum sp.]
MRITWSLGAWMPVLRRLPTGSAGQVALTVDDGPTPEATPAMLDAFERFGHKATFFLSGFRVEASPALVEEILARGHAVYAHAWEHIRLDKEPTERLVGDMERCETLLSGFRPKPLPYIIRLPKNGGYRNARVHRALKRWSPGGQFAHWLLSTEDHLISPRCTSEADIAPECRKEVDRLLADPRLPGSIVLMHDQPINDRPGAQFKAGVTIELARQLAEGLAGAGLRSVPIVPLAAQPWWTRIALV